MDPMSHLLDQITALRKFVLDGPISAGVLMFTFYAIHQGGHELIQYLMTSASPSPHALIASASRDLFFAANCLALAFLMLSSAIVSSTHDADWSDYRHHVAMAWSSGVLGTTLLFLEVNGVSEYQFEDLLLAASAVNMLVKELKSRPATG